MVSETGVSTQPSAGAELAVAFCRERRNREGRGLASRREERSYEADWGSKLGARTQARRSAPGQRAGGQMSDADPRVGGDRPTVIAPVKWCRTEIFLSLTNWAHAPGCA